MRQCETLVGAADLVPVTTGRDPEHTTVMQLGLGVGLARSYGHSWPLLATRVAFGQLDASILSDDERCTVNRQITLSPTQLTPSARNGLTVESVER